MPAADKPETTRVEGSVERISIVAKILKLGCVYAEIRGVRGFRKWVVPLGKKRLGSSLYIYAYD